MSKKRAAERDSGGRGFSIIELLVVLAILGLTLTVAGATVMRAIKRSYLSSTVQGLQLLASRAQLEAQRRSTMVFLRIGPVGSGPNGTLPVELWADADGDGVFTAASDLRIQQVLLDPKRISLSTVASNQIQSANWSQDADTSKERLLACNTFGQTMTYDPSSPDPPSTLHQITATATLTVTHTDMISSVLLPRLNDQLRISPAWSVEIRETTY
jgi:prepilin-type N-terminal cleavage/methylation domain-containing protein